MADLLNQIASFAHGLFGGFFYMVSWIDERVNVNEGVIALVALLIGVGMQSLTGARRLAGYVFIALAFAFMFVAFFQGSVHIIRGAGNLQAVLPEPFKHIHSPDNTFLASDGTSVIASDDAEMNSVQLSSGTLRTAPDQYLKSRCPAKDQVAAGLLERNEIDDADKTKVTVSVLHAPKGGARDACWLSWQIADQKIDHYEVYVTVPAEGGGYLYAHLHLRAESPNHVLVGGDYAQIRNSLLISAGIDPKAIVQP